MPSAYSEHILSDDLDCALTAENICRSSAMEDGSLLVMLAAMSCTLGNAFVVDGLGRADLRKLQWKQTNTHTHTHPDSQLSWG